MDSRRKLTVEESFGARWEQPVMKRQRVMQTDESILESKANADSSPNAGRIRSE